MRTKLIATIAVLTLCSGMKAQTICRQSVVFFDHDKSELTDPAKRKLDSLARVMKGDEYIVELYGHTDTTGSADYNYRLAHKRMRTIEGYLRPQTDAKLVFTENNLSETASKIGKNTDKNLAYNRRVDIYFIPTTGGNVQMTGKNKGSIEAPPALFGPCGICNSVPEVKTYKSHAETEKANIELATTSGDSLITAGMIMLTYDPCTGKATKVPDVKFKMCPGQRDPGMSLWEADTVNGKIQWIASKDSLSFDVTCGCYVFKGKPNKIYNIDKKYVAGPQPPPPPPDTAYKILPTLHFAYEQFITTDPKNQVKYNAERDSVEVAPEARSLRTYAVAKAGEDYYLFSMPVDSLPSKQRKEENTVITSYSLPNTAYSKLEFSDTLVKIRCGKKAVPGQCGVYLTEYHQYIPFDSTDGKYYYGYKPTVAFQYAYKKGSRLRALKKAPEKRKYLEGEHTERIKFKKKERSKFRSVRIYFEAQA